MAALNFPTENLQAGVTQYTSDLGTTYIWDGVKWVGHSAGGSVGTNSISNNGNTVQVNADGDLVLPAYTLPNTAGTEAQVLTWPASGTVLEWTDQTGTGGGGGGLTIADFGEGFSLTASNKIVTNKLYSTNETEPNQHYRLELDTNGVVVLPDQSIINGSTMRGVYGTGELNYTALTIGPDANHREESWIWVDAGGAHIGTSYSGDINPTQQWNFSNDGYFTFPQGGSLGYDEESDSTQITYQGNISLNNAGGTWMFGANDGTLSLAGDILVGANDGHIYIDRALSGATSIRWVNTEFDTTLFRVYADSKQDLNNEKLEIGYVADDGFYISTTENANGLWNNPGDDHSWTFDNTGNLVLPEGGDILNSSGQSVLGGGVSGTADRVQFANAGSISQIADEAPNRYNIVVDAEKDVVVKTDEGGYEFRFTSNGSLQLTQGSTIGDQSNSVDITVGRTSNNPYWYNLFGDTGATGNNYANTAINGSVVHDAGGNVYVLGSTISWNNGFGGNNLFLKYSPEGNLLWRRTWTDDNGLTCGSYNASLRYVAANVDLGTQDTIVWAAQVPWDKISYIGTMDMEGNLVDQFGNARLPTRLDNFAVTDLEWVGPAEEVGDSTVLVIGQQFLPGPGYHFPALGGIDLANAAVIATTTIMPDGTNLNYGDPNNNPSYVNQFKAAVTIPAYQSNPAAGALVGTYYDGSYSHAMVALSSNGPPVTYGIGVDNYSEDNIIGEDICADANGNVYVIVNNITSNTAVLIKATAASLDDGYAIWKLSLGPFSADGFYATAVAYNNGYVYVLGQYYNNSTNDTDAVLIKVGIANGNVVWQRRIGSPGYDGVNFFGSPGAESSSGISVYDGVVAISFATETQTPGLGGPPESNTVTLQYPTDGSLTGTYGDFVISDFDIGNEANNYNITTLSTALGGEAVSSGFAALLATTAAVGTGWTNTQWDLENNREVVGEQTFKFMADGTFDTREIKHTSTVKITANTVSGANAATWTFQDNRGLRFPDGSVQYGAYVETEIALDGGSAVTVFNIPMAVTVADGGGSGTRHGVTDPVYDGNNGNNYVLDGGGA